MKTLIFISVISLFFLSCEKKEVQKEENSLNLKSKNYYGCFKANVETLKNGYEDTAYLTVKDDNLILNIVKVHNCCGKLSDETDIIGDNVNIYIQDTCKGNCICRCLCNWGFEYRFTGYKIKNTSFYIYIKEFNQAEYILWKKTEFIDGLD